MLQLILASKAESEARLGQVRAPVLIVMGSRDPDFKNPAAEANWIAARLSASGGVEMRMVEGVGYNR